MATLHKEFNTFNKTVKLSDAKRISLIKSRTEIKRKIRVYFQNEKKDELQPKFWAQGSFEMKTTVNPIPTENASGEKLYEYDLDYGVYLIEKDGENNIKPIETWHNWVYDAVDDHTNIPSKDKDTCVRVVFADGHHIDLPIYYKLGDKIELAHKTKGWLISDPLAFYEWFNEKAKDNQQLRRIVRYLKSWKNYREWKNTNLKLPSGFELTILAVNNFKTNDRDDIALKDTVESINNSLNKRFECLRPTTPVNENVFDDYSETRKNNFLTALKSLIDDCNKALDEKNFKNASEYLRKQFGERFPQGEDKNEDDKSKELEYSLKSSLIAKPYFKNDRSRF
jgi:hypothetical protein